MAKRGPTPAIAALLLILAGPLSAQQLRLPPSGDGIYGPHLRLPPFASNRRVMPQPARTAVSLRSVVAQPTTPAAWTVAAPVPVLSRVARPAALGVGAQQRPRAIEYSDAYYTRLTIHRYGSYAILPLFAGEYVLGKRLLDGGNVASWVRPWHRNLAAGIGVLFAVNTVTGVWNMVEGWQEPEGRTRRILHSALMLAADAGFLYTASLAGEGEDDEFGEGGGGAFESEGNPTRHRNAALVSIGLSTVSTLMMWLWQD